MKDSITSKRDRLLLLGKIADRGLIAFGLALIFTALGRLLFNIHNSPLSIPQAIQGILGLLFFILGIYNQTTLLLHSYNRVTYKNIVKVIIGVFPFLSFSLFFIYRIQLSDFKSYSRLVEEGSLVEWLSFLSLLISAFLFLMTAKDIFKTLIGKFLLSISCLAFVLAMEEVSWGQMIFNWKSPRFFAETNAQQETNIHNLILLSGQPNTILVTIVLFTLTVFCLLRLYLKSRGKVKANTILDIVLPPFILIGYFAIGALIYFCLVLQMQGLEIPILIPKDQEFFECFFALGVLLNACRVYINCGYDS